ncbi:MAG: ATP-binding protein [Veillonellaceae bacterium]|nr:ATP-binding protein [Veillonellaceae bacterium]
MSNLTELNKLIIFRNILNDTILNRLLDSAVNDAPSISYQITHELLTKAEQLQLQGNALKSYLMYLILNDENIFSTTVETTGGAIGESLFKAVVHDISILQDVLKSDLRCLTNEFLEDFHPTHCTITSKIEEMTNYFLDNTGSCPAEKIFKKLVDYYTRFGHGEMAQYAAFRWSEDGVLVGVKHYDQIRLEDIIGYDRQKETLIRNTEAFLANKPANNVLLVGARGTGKSSSVKALVNRYFTDGLRLVEIAKHQIKYLHELMSSLRNRGKKFILFLDDLSFEDYEVEYKYLKSVLDGGVESKPANVIIIATSNRRHLVRELWNDRSENNSDIHRNDTINEKISLSDRFGITLTYLQPNQEEYLTIVEEMAKKHNIALCPAQLRSEAIKWELSHSGRSGRTAQQFISYILGNVKTG